MNTYDWFYIQHVQTRKVMSFDTAKTQLQAVMVDPRLTDDELWRWDGYCLINKSTGLALDKGRIRFSEDTEICLSQKKWRPSDNQQWYPKTDYKPARRLFGKIVRAKTPIGHLIHSATNSDWVLEVCPRTQKVILFPVHNDHSRREQQRWEFVSEETMSLSYKQTEEIEEPGLLYETESTDSSISYYSPTPSISAASASEFTYGLTPARKRSSQSSSSSSSSRKKSQIESSFYDCISFHPRQF